MPLAAALAELASCQQHSWAGNGLRPQVFHGSCADPTGPVVTNVSIKRTCAFGWRDHPGIYLARSHVVIRLFTLFHSQEFGPDDAL